MKKFIRSTQFPFLLFGFLLLVMLVTLFLEARTYGITTDAPLQNDYGQRVLHWYTSFGKDISFLRYPPDFNMPQHGPFFEVVVAAAQRLFGHEWYTRAVVTGLAGVLGVVAIALCGFELGGPWLGLVAALFLWLFPRVYGEMWINSKDIPLTTAMTLILWMAIRLVKHWEDQKKTLINSLGLGICIGIATSIRVLAVLWYPMLVLVLLYWWVSHFKQITNRQQLIGIVRRQVVMMVIIGLASYVTMILLWPYIFLSPVANLIDSIEVMRRYPWDGTLFFNGGVVKATRLPRWYAPWWIVIGSPSIDLVLALVGFVLMGLYAVKTKRLNAMALVALAFLFPLAALVGMHAVLYNAERQFLFLTPPLLLIGAYAFVKLVDILLRQQRRVLLALVLLCVFLAYGNILVTMNLLHPYEYTYFNELFGGLSVMQSKYEVEYWRICYKPATEWVIENYQHYPHAQQPTIGNDFVHKQVEIYMPSNFRLDTEQPDFYILTVFDKPGPQFTHYHIIHQEKIMGQVTACTVYGRN